MQLSVVVHYLYPVLKFELNLTSRSRDIPRQSYKIGIFKYI